MEKENTPVEASKIEITLTLTLDEVNFALGAIGKEPYATVAGLIDKIKNQAIPQLPKPTEGQ